MLIPFDDNSPYDLVINIENKFYKIQVKTCEKVRFGEYASFSTKVTNPYTCQSRRYDSNEVDYFVLHCVENGWTGLVPFDEHSSETKVRMIPPKNKQSKKVKLHTEYEISFQLKKIFGIEPLSKNIIHDEERKHYERRKILCPICNETKIKPTSSMCINCYNKSRKPSFNTIE